MVSNVNAIHRFRSGVWFGVLTGVVIACCSTGIAQAQVPPEIEASLRKIGQIVDPPCTAKLYRPLMPKNDYNTYWPAGAEGPAVLKEPLYPGVALARDVKFGTNAKDLIDIFSPEKGGGNRTVLIYVPGGAGNKLEQQDREANAFYDNIGRWAVKNDMIGVTMQRHPGQNWDDGGRDISRMVQWLQENITKYKGNPNRMFIWAHSAGNGPLGVYIGHPELYGPKGVGVKGAVFMSGNPVPDLGGQGGGRGAGGANILAGSTCGVTSGAGGSDGAISGPSGVTPAPAGARGADGRGGRGGQQLDPATAAARANLPGFKSTPVKIVLARAELDPGVTGGMAASDIALHDELCKAGPDHCPTMLYLKDESHMSEVFSIDTPDKTVSGPILEWIKKTK
jgi:triacylglycerol lipase